MDVRTAVRNSRSYALLQRFRMYAAHSAVATIATDRRYLSLGFLGFVGLSVARLVAADMSESIKFLSFVVLFLALALLVSRIGYSGQS